MNASSAASAFERLRGSLNIGAVHAGARRPFKFFVCGDPALLGDLRATLLAGHDGDSIPPEAAAAFETLDLQRSVDTSDARAVICVARPGDRATLPLQRFAALRLPVLVLILDPAAAASTGPAQPRRPAAPKSTSSTASRSKRCAGAFCRTSSTAARGSRSRSGAGCPPYATR